MILKEDNANIINDSKNFVKSLSTIQKPSANSFYSETDSAKKTSSCFDKSKPTMNNIFLTIPSESHIAKVADVSESYSYGVKSLKSNELDNLMKDIDVWGVNIFLIDELTEHRPLTAVAYTIFKVFILFYKYIYFFNIYLVKLLI